MAGDLLVSPHTFSVREVNYWLFEGANASLVTPSIVSRGVGYRAGRESISSQRMWGDCIALTSALAEQMKISRADAFESALWTPILSAVPDQALATDSYVMQLWCILATTLFPQRPGCVHLRHQSVVHIDSRSIVQAGLANAYHARDKGGTILDELYDRFPWAFETFRYSASQSLCWSLLEEGRPITNARSPLPSKAVAERNLLPQPQEPISTSMAPHVLKKLRQRKAGARASSATYGT